MSKLLFIILLAESFLVYVNQTILNGKLWKKLGGQTGGQAKNLEGHGPPRLPHRIATEHGYTSCAMLNCEL